MSIIVNVDVMLAKRKMSSAALAEKVGITPANLSILKTGKAKAVRFPRWRRSAGLWTASRGMSLNIQKNNNNLIRIQL